MSFWKPYELPIYMNNKMSCVMEFVSKRERDDYMKKNPLSEGYSYEKVYGQAADQITSPEGAKI